MSTNMPPERVPAQRRAYCTYFDSKYLSRGIVMIRSLLEHEPTAAMYVLCLDDIAAPVLNAWFGTRVTTVQLGEIHKFDARLPELRSKRHTWAFYATHKPAFLHYLLCERGPFEWIVFVDADTGFYSGLAPAIDEIATASIGLSPHRFADRNDSRKACGKFNAGFVCFRDDPIARRCLVDWRQNCIDWCDPEPLPDGRYMNQGYLNRWLERYPNVAVIRHPGANVAPWNVRGCRIEFVNGKGLVDGLPLIFFHFSALIRRDNGEWHTYYVSDLGPLPELRAALYVPYVRQVEAVRKQLMETQGLTGTGSVRSDPAA